MSPHVLDSLEWRDCIDGHEWDMTTFIGSLVAFRLWWWDFALIYIRGSFIWLQIWRNLKMSWQKNSGFLILSNNGLEVMMMKVNCLKTQFLKVKTIDCPALFPITIIKQTHHLGDFQLIRKLHHVFFFPVFFLRTLARRLFSALAFVCSAKWVSFSLFAVSHVCLTWTDFLCILRLDLIILAHIIHILHGY